METGYLGARSTKDRWVLPGALTGVAAGMIFVTFQMVAATVVGADFLTPLGMAGAVVLGQGALDGSHLPELTALAGLPVYVIASAACGAAFGTLSALGPVRRSRGALLVAATAFGALLWIADFALVARGALPQFPAANPAVQFVAYAFFFGTALGLMLGVRFRTEETAGEQARVSRGTGDRGLPGAPR